VLVVTAAPATPLDVVTGRLRGSVALVTGAGRGVGRLVATSFADAGAAIGMVARSADELGHTVDLITSTGGVAAAAVADVTDPAGLAGAVADLRNQLGPVDLLVNNAGILGPRGPLWELAADEWWTTLDVNVRGLVLATQLVLPDMVAAGRGRIISITSQAGVHRWPLASAYSVSKAAVVKLTENLALETRRHGVGVFSVHPGLLPIGISETIAAETPANGHEAHIRAWALNALAEGRGADPARAAGLLLRIAAGDADRLTGRHLSVHDDLDRLLGRLPEVLEHDLYVLRPDALTDRDGSPTHLSPRPNTGGDIR
jgi:NAD(P)-dependent dehydrogenase (short-subunit alcohol dehydrogenase family)